MTALSLEIEEAEELDVKYKNKFTKDFHNEMQFRSNKVKEEEDRLGGHEIGGEEEHQKNPVEGHPLLKQIFREVVKKTHPDRHGDTHLKNFKNANEAHENHDWTALLLIAVDLDIEIPVFGDDVASLITNEIEKKKSLIQKRKETLAWGWANSVNPSEETRKRVRQIMGIDEGDFQEFLKNQD